MLRKTRRIVLLLLISLSALAADQRKVTLLYSNDFHAAIEPTRATWLVDQPMIGGVRDFAAWAAMLRRTLPNAFFFDAGDVYTGQAISSISRGQALIDIWKTLGYDAGTFGNHEFDYGVDRAVAYAQQESFPVLSANLFYRDSGKHFAKPYAIIQRNGIRIAVTGVFGLDAIPSTGPAIWKTLEARDPVPILRELVPKLRKQADLVIVLAHEGENGSMQSDAEAHPEVQKGFEADKALAAAVPGIDVIIGGHAHRGIEVPWVSPKNGTIIVQTYGRGTTIGVLQLSLDSANRISTHQGSLVRILPGVFPVPEQVDKVVTRWVKEADQIGREVIGTLPAALIRNYNGESNLGNLIADAMLWKTGADIAFENAGGIRADLKAGTVTRYDLISVLPFINTVTTIKLTGKQIRQILEQSLTLKVGMMQVANLRVTYDPKRSESQRVVTVTVGDTPLDDSKTYLVATNSFISAGGDRYSTFLDGADLNDTGQNLVDAVIDYVRHPGVHLQPQSGRLVAIPTEPPVTP
ncbi:MAG TPA: bifunctional UDP-sugar hydrolase/5'-nucleotidase [Terriglobales bacterium]|nr:bifunctional UDP-sugar hydrolase/5'-nucleotidase [Terriglobales bacterium]